MRVPYSTSSHMCESVKRFSTELSAYTHIVSDINANCKAKQETVICDCLIHAKCYRYMCIFIIHNTLCVCNAHLCTVVLMFENNMR